MSGQPLPSDRDRVIYRCVGHYMADVAELLMRDGYPVVYVGSCPPEELHDSEHDAGGYVDLGESVLTQVGGVPEKAKSVYFDWDSSSGWSLVLNDTATRWMGAGLAPGPDKVSAFFLSALLDFHNTGSDERPHYRKPGHDLDGLAERLRPFHRDGDFKERFRNQRHVACHRAAASDVLSGDTLLSVPLRSSELAALARMADFLDMNDELRSLATSLVTDLRARAVPTTDDAMHTAVSLHSSARAHAQKAHPKKD